jgi:hypothetical protein
VGAGTDATRVASYNPWMSLYWLTSGKTVGGTRLYGTANRLDRAEALRRYTLGSAWFSGEETKKGALVAGQLADLAVLSADYFRVPEEAIKDIVSVMTVVDGRVVHAAEEFAPHAPPSIPVLPEWSPIQEFGGYHLPKGSPATGPIVRASALSAPVKKSAPTRRPSEPKEWKPLGGLGCDCFAF